MKKLSYLSLFSSAGVGCYAFKKLGFKCIGTAELLEKRIQIQQFNNICDNQNDYIVGDIASTNIKKKISDLKSTANDLDLVIATPPCQGISVANHKKKNELKRNSLIVESIIITKSFRPKFFIFENVRSFLKTYCTGSDKKEKLILEEIYSELSSDYNYKSRILNLANFGSSSSRTRCLVIGVRKDIKIDPEKLFPEEEKSKNIKDLIGHLPSLKKMGDIDPDDIFHSFRQYDVRMLPWIEKLKEGQSAFENKDKKKIPHHFIGNKLVFNKNKNADKYKRQKWSQIPPCIHTRNDILASQNTVHPRDNRVFSIRELMIFMTIPKDFKWTNKSFSQLNKMDINEKKNFLKKNELNIRHCIGESVPTNIFYKIGKKILEQKSIKKLNNIRLIQKIVNEEKLADSKKLLKFIQKNFDNYDLDTILKIIELANSKRHKNSAFFTDSFIVRDIINFINFEDRDLKILEPSVGSGNFLFKLLDFLKFYKSKIIIDVFDIDNAMLQCVSLILKKIKIPKNIQINIFNNDFLLHNFKKKKYDYVIGNPPFGKITDKNLISNYILTGLADKNLNLFILFYKRSLELSSNVNLIIPKSFLSSPEYNVFRNEIAKYNVGAIFDFGEKGFKGVKIETIYLQINGLKVKSKNQTFIKSYITNEARKVLQDYYSSSQYPTWLIYRDKQFDKISSGIKFNIFNFFRDRQLTKKNTKLKGKFRVIKSRNISNNNILNIENYDRYVDSVETLQVSKFINKKNTYIVPNLSYYPRAAKLPLNSITDGSAAILTPKNGYSIEKKDLEFFSSDEFSKFYKIARNLGTRSLNIDKNSVFFWGIKR